MKSQIAKEIRSGNVSLGIELGSTRIKAVLIDSKNVSIAQGDFEWENKLVDGYWTYSLIEIWNGISVCYTNLKRQVKSEYDVNLTNIKNIGISAMMHGYIVLDENDELLVPFRTWRNTNQEQASTFLSELYNYPMPQRFSNAHIYQAILNQEEHVNQITHQTTLAGYIHYRLTGEKVLGVGEASGMFPIDLNTKDFNQDFIQKFNDVVHKKGITWDYQDLLPKVLVAGENAGVLTEEGAKLLDPSGDLQPGSNLCPPEGDAGTGMVATNSVAKKTGNVSAGTSVFAMIVLEDDLKAVHPEIDLVTTPSGNLVGMVHCNNCTSNLNSWINLFDQVTELFGIEVSKNELYTKLFKKALESDKDAGGLLSYEYLSGEHITGFEEGRPLFVMNADSNFNLANFMRCGLYSSLGALKIGLDILLKEEQVKLEKIYGHGGFFKTEEVGQRIMSQATNSPVSIMDNAGEGGAWGIAILASYQDSSKTLDDYLNEEVFHGSYETTIMATEEEINGFEMFMSRYQQGLAIERAAVDNLK
ncbi:FGGY-family carbohydrate kinase [Mollicutes bacterium LVI A0039]|nr:FGGY-family carbohydrate kinase [Mollicutes bacterium LVI A0039]